MTTVFCDILMKEDVHGYFSFLNCLQIQAMASQSSSEQESCSEWYLYNILNNQKFGMLNLTFLLCFTFLQLMKKTATASQNSFQRS